MKNLKNYFASTVLLLFFCTLPFACTTENAVSDNQNAENKSIQDQSVKPGTKKTAETACDCLPILKAQYINNDGSVSGSTRGEFWFESPSTCTVDWMNINTIKLQLGGISFGVGSNTSVKINANSYNNWTNTPTSPAYYNMRILTNNNTTLPVAAPGGLFTFPNSPGSAFEGWATITFKNGCPAQTIYTVYGGIE